MELKHIKCGLLFLFVALCESGYDYNDDDDRPIWGDANEPAKIVKTTYKTGGPVIPSQRLKMAGGDIRNLPKDLLAKSGSGKTQSYSYSSSYGRAGGLSSASAGASSISYGGLGFMMPGGGSMSGASGSAGSIQGQYMLPGGSSMAGVSSSALTYSAGESGSMAAASAVSIGKSYECSKMREQQNAVVKCADGNGMCKINCETDYQFPNGVNSVTFRCTASGWTDVSGEWTEIPTCEPICNPQCENNGICISPGVCQCPDNFMGTQCQTEKKFCLSQPTVPENSKRSCTATSCTVTCSKGYRYPDGTSSMNLYCKDGNWKLSKSDLKRVPDCKPYCNQKCENEGKCISPNVCQCPNEFKGLQCQYSAEICAPKKMNFNGGYNCSGRADTFSCSLYCPGGYNFTEKPAPLYTCSYKEGVFKPDNIPACLYPPGVKVDVKEKYKSFSVQPTRTVKKTKKTKVQFVKDYDEGSDEDDEDEETIETTIIKKTKKVIKGKKGKKKGGRKESIEIEEEDEDYEEIEGIYGMNTQQDISLTYVKPKPMMCMTWNGNKIKTFDGLIYNAPLYCSHTLLQDKVSGIYSIILKSCPYEAPEPCYPSIIIMLNDQKYSVINEKGNISLITKQKTMKLPVQITGFRAKRTSNSVRISLETIQTKIIWDTKKMVQIEAPVSLWNKTLGLCGTMDGKMTNDFMDKNGVVAQVPNTFVDSWKVELFNDATDNCEFDGKNILDEVKCSDKLAAEANDVCERLLSNQKLLMCFEGYSKKALLRACLADYCGCASDDRTKCACQGITILARDCKFRGVTIDNEWRDMEVCPVICTSGRVYKACGPTTEPACGTATEAINLSCQEGCFCPSGTIWHEEKCITELQCPCKLRNKVFSPGASIKKDCNLCTRRKS